MSAWLIVLLMATGFVLLGTGQRSAALGGQDTLPRLRGGLRSNPGRGTRRWSGAAGHSGKTFDSHELSSFVRQLAALLRSGRSPQSLWRDIAGVYEVVAVDSGTQPSASRRLFARAIVPVLATARVSADLGYSVSDCLRRHGSITYAGDGSARASAPLRQMWADIALCCEVAERSGAPLASLLSRYADQIEAELDNQAARETSLAAPRATARLLTWLPLFGLGLGMLTGADPLDVLFTTPVGWAAGTLGVLLMAAGRFWSSRLVAAAALTGSEA